MGKQEVNKDTLKMECSEQNRTSEGARVNKTDILRDFQASFFAMSRLASFPWTVSETGRYDVSIHHKERALRQTPFKYLTIRDYLLSEKCAQCQNMTEIILQFNGIFCIIRHTYHPPKGRN